MFQIYTKTKRYLFGTTKLINSITKCVTSKRNFHTNFVFPTGNLSGQLGKRRHNFTNIYCKIPLIRPGRIYGKKTKLMGLYYAKVMGGGEGEIIFGGKNTSICNLLNSLFFFFQYKARILAFFRSCKMSTIKTPEYVKLSIKLKIKTPLTSFWPLYC